MVIVTNHEMKICHRTAFIIRHSTGVRLKKRSSLDIISTILEASNGGIGKTRLIERANLTTSQFNRYIQFLVSKNLLSRSPEASHPTYKTTALGMQYVALYGAIKNSLYLKPVPDDMAAGVFDSNIPEQR